MVPYWQPEFQSVSCSLRFNGKSDYVQWTGPACALLADWGSTDEDSRQCRIFEITFRAQPAKPGTGSGHQKLVRLPLSLSMKTSCHHGARPSSMHAAALCPVRRKSSLSQRMPLMNSAPVCLGAISPSQACIGHWQYKLLSPTV